MMQHIRTSSGSIHNDTQHLRRRRCRGAYVVPQARVSVQGFAEVLGGDAGGADARADAGADAGVGER
jgi:hypothetical protein